MSSLSKLDFKSGVKTLVAANKQQLVVDEQKNHGLKLWQLGLLLGVPSALLAFYFIYSRNNLKNNKDNKKDNKLKDDSKDVKKNTKPKDESNLSLDERIKNILDTVTEHNSEKLLEKAVLIKNLGNEYFQIGKFDDAARCYSEAIKLCPVNDKDELPKFYQNRAAAFENLKLYHQVIEDCSAALKVDPNYSKALARRAKAFESIDHLQEAFEDHTALCILQKFSGSSMASADRIVKKIGEKMGREIFQKRESIPISQHFVNNFFIGLNNDIVFKNQEFFDKVKEKNAETMLNALIEFNDGKYEKCIENCNAVIENENEFKLEARNLRGSLYMLRCQYKEAKIDFEFILNSDEASNRIKSNTYIKLTALNLQNGEESQAFDNYDKAIEIDPLNEDIYCNRAQVYAMKGRFEECFKDFEKCIEINSDHKIAKLQKAFFEFRQFYAQITMTTPQNSLVESRELKEETIKLEKLLDEYSEVPEAYNLYAQILSEQENYEKAEKFYKIALENDPNNAALLVQRALNIMTWKNDFNEPIEMLNEAIQIDSTCEFAYETLATIEIQRGNLNRAVELFEQAINLTRSEDSLTNLCCMLVGAKTQFKILQQYRTSPNFEY